jgi:hypothetical protein
MRLSIEINVTGSTLDEIMSNSIVEWNRLSQSDSSSLPSGSEIDITPNQSAAHQGPYAARVFIRTKVEDNV